MTQEKINRINQLARKSRIDKLTKEELAEQQELRTEYRQSFLSNLTGQLENMTIVKPDGTKKDVKDLKK